MFVHQNSICIVDCELQCDVVRKSKVAEVPNMSVVQSMFVQASQTQPCCRTYNNCGALICQGVSTVELLNHHYSNHIQGDDAIGHCKLNNDAKIPVQLHISDPLIRMFVSMTFRQLNNRMNPNYKYTSRCGCCCYIYIFIYIYIYVYIFSSFKYNI